MDKIDKVFIVTSGDYSDYRISGVFTTRGLAENYIKMFGNSDFNDIEIYSVNPFAQEARDNYSPFFIRMGKNGNTISCKQVDSDYGFREEDESRGFDIHGNMYIHVIAKDRVHAIKIANEKRVQLIAMNIWPI